MILPFKQCRLRSLATIAFTFYNRVKISGPLSVIATVCSKWAERLPSCVTAVHPSSNIFTPETPALIIGSIASVIPGLSRGP